MRKIHHWQALLLAAFLYPQLLQAQIDPVPRQLFQLGYNQPLVGKSPVSGYAFYYRNQPDFPRTNQTLRLAIAPVYLDSELGFHRALGDDTDVAIGVAGGGFADSYSEIHNGKWEKDKSFTGHGGEISASIYHLFNPNQKIPLNGVLRGTAHYSVYERESDTDSDFRLPDDRGTFSLRAGLRLGGQEPTLFPALAMEISAWYEGQFRTDSGPYGFRGGDWEVEPYSHLFWTRALLAYTFPELGHSFYVSFTAGTSIHADRFSAYRLGALLPLVSEFPLDLPGYFYQEISARQFVLLAGNYNIPLDAKERWNVNLYAASAGVDYLPGLSQHGRQQNGVGAGILYRSPSDAWKVMLGYGYGIDAIRDGDRGAHSIGFLMQFDLEQAMARGLIPAAPGQSRGLQRILGWGL